MARKKILLISYYFNFPDSAGSVRAKAMLKYFPKYDVDIYVLTSDSQLRVIKFNKNIISVPDISKETHSLFVVYSKYLWQQLKLKLGIYEGKREYWRDRAIHHAGQIINYVNPDMIICSYPVIEALEIGIVLSEKFNIPLIGDFRDGLMFEPIEERRLSNLVIKKHYEYIERRVIELAGLIITVSDPISEYFRIRYSHSYVITVSNGYDSDINKPNIAVYLPDNQINIVHTGRLSGAEKGRNPTALIIALTNLIDRLPNFEKKIQFHFVGQLSRYEIRSFDNLVRRGLIVLWGHQSRSVARGLQSKADILLLVTQANKKSMVTSKLFEYFEANKPILALAEGSEAARIIIETASGMVVSSENLNEIEETIEKIVFNGAEFLWPNEKQITDRYTWNTLIGNLASIILDANCINETECYAQPKAR